jgi:hypothetical protein
MQMSEEQVEMPMEEGVEAPAEEHTVELTESKEAQPNIADELHDLGRNLAAATKAALESPEAQELGTQFHRGLESLEKSVHQVVAQVRETRVGQQIEDGVSEATTVVRDRGLLETLSESIATALHTVNKTLEQAVEKAQARTEEAKAHKRAPQQIEVVKAEEQLSIESEASEE